MLCGRTLTRHSICAVELRRSRDVLRLAIQELEDLKAVQHDPALFADSFVRCIGMIDRVGAVINAETRGHRTQEFGQWWKQTSQDAMLKFVHEVRNGEFKQGELRRETRHELKDYETMTYTESATVEKFDEQGRHVETVHRAGTPSRRPLTPPPSHEITFLFIAGVYDRWPVLTVLEQHLHWLQGEILPTAERLTR